MNDRSTDDCKPFQLLKLMLSFYDVKYDFIIQKIVSTQTQLGSEKA